MRKIKFRGQDKSNQRWIYGSLEIPLLNQDVSKCYIVGYAYGQYQNHEVCRDTVDQFTGLHDKSGVEIFEGDIVKDYWNNLYIVEFGDYYEEIDYGIIASGNGWYMSNVKEEHDDKSIASAGELTVIGNIHENSDLLEH